MVRLSDFRHLVTYHIRLRHSDFWFDGRAAAIIISNTSPRDKRTLDNKTSTRLVPDGKYKQIQRV